MVNGQQGLSLGRDLEGEMGSIELIAACDVSDSARKFLRDFMKLRCMGLAVKLWYGECWRWSIAVRREGACEEQC